MNKFITYSQEQKRSIQNETRRLTENWLTEINSDLPIPPHLLPVFSWCGKIGKGLRGTLVILTATSFGNTDKTNAVRIAGIVELLQTALLIHDDLMDGSKERRGGASFHEQLSEHLAARGHREHETEGRKIALAVSNHLLQWLNQKVFELSVELDLTELTEVFLQYTAQTMHGQLSDVSNEEILTDTLAIKDVYSAKTGAYSFCLPFVLGYTLAKSYYSLTQELILEVMGENLGIILQSHDDLSGFSSHNEALSELREDITNRQPALWSALLIKQLNPNEASFFKTLWKTQVITDADLYYLRFLFQKYVIKENVRELTEAETKLCHQLVNDLEIEAEYRRLWHSLVDFISEGYKT